MKVDLSEMQQGQVFYERVVTNLSRTQIVQYAGASDDFNPLHTDEVYATKVAGYPSVIAHGMMTMGLTAKALTDLVGVDELRRFGGRFIDVVYPGDDLTTRIEVLKISRNDDKINVDIHISTSNQDEHLVFEGSAVASIALANGEGVDP